MTLAVIAGTMPIPYLIRLVELTTQAANDINTDADRDAIKDEIDQLNQEIDRSCANFWERSRCFIPVL